MDRWQSVGSRPTFNLDSDTLFNMKNALTHKDKVRLATSGVIVIVGVLAMIFASWQHRINPPVDADIGNGLIYVFGMTIAVSGCAIFVAMLSYAYLRRTLPKLWMARILAFAIGVLAVSVGTYGLAAI
jgi:hypothetical protein